MGSMEAHQKVIFDILRHYGLRPDIKLWPNNTGTAYRRGRPIKFGLKGSADILGIMQGGRMIAIEVKTGSARQTVQQKAFQKMITQLGGLYILAHSIEDVKKAVE